MTTLARSGMATVAGLATFYSVGWIAAAILSIVLPGVASASIAFLGAGAVAVLVARWVLRSPPRVTQSPAGAGIRSPLASSAMGAVVLGGLGFCAGFFGPMILSPESNQGPLLGIFITGPVGVVVGAVWGYLRHVGQRTNP